MLTFPELAVNACRIPVIFVIRLKKLQNPLLAGNVDSESITVSSLFSADSSTEFVFDSSTKSSSEKMVILSRKALWTFKSIKFNR